MPRDKVLEQTAGESLGPRYLRGEQLLDTLFQPSCRPSLRWLRSQQKAKTIPYVKVGRFVFFDPVAVKLHLDSTRTIKAR